MGNDIKQPDLQIIEIENLSGTRYSKTINHKILSTLETNKDISNFVKTNYEELKQILIDLVNSQGSITDFSGLSPKLFKMDQESNSKKVTTIFEFVRELALSYSFGHPIVLFGGHTVNINVIEHDGNNYYVIRKPYVDGPVTVCTQQVYEKYITENSISVLSSIPEIFEYIYTSVNRLLIGGIRGSDILSKLFLEQNAIHTIEGIQDDSSDDLSNAEYFRNIYLYLEDLRSVVEESDMSIEARDNLQLFINVLEDLSTKSDQSQCNLDIPESEPISYKNFLYTVIRENLDYFREIITKYVDKTGEVSLIQMCNHFLSKIQKNPKFSKYLDDIVIFTESALSMSFLMDCGIYLHVDDSWFLVFEYNGKKYYYCVFEGLNECFCNKETFQKNEKYSKYYLNVSLQYSKHKKANTGTIPDLTSREKVQNFLSLNLNKIIRYFTTLDIISFRLGVDYIDFEPLFGFKITQDESRKILIELIKKLIKQNTNHIINLTKDDRVIVLELPNGNYYYISNSSGEELIMDEISFIDYKEISGLHLETDLDKIFSYILSELDYVLSRGASQRKILKNIVGEHTLIFFGDKFNYRIEKEGYNLIDTIADLGLKMNLYTGGNLSIVEKMMIEKILFIIHNSLEQKDN